MNEIKRYPKLTGMFISITSGAIAVLLIANSSNQIQALGIEIIGLSVGIIGVIIYRKQHRFIGTLVIFIGIVIAVVSIGFGWVSASSVTRQIEAPPGMIGLIFLAGGVSGIRRGWERGLIMTGTALILISVLVSGAVFGASLIHLLAGTVATVIAWDAAEQAVNLGEQVGSAAKSWTAEFAHIGGSIITGVIAVGLTFGIYQFGIEGVSLAGLFFLLIGVVILTAALYN